MRVGIDITWMGDKPAGVGTMTADVIRELGGRHDVELVLFCRKDQRVAFKATCVTLEPGNRHWRLYKAILSASIDVLWQTGAWLPLIVPRGVFCIQTVHDLISYDHPEWFAQTGVSAWWSRTIRVPHALQAADRIHAISRYTQRQILKHFPHVEEKIFVAYQGVEVPVKIAPYAHVRPYVLVLGTVEPRKNLEGVAQAYRAFAETYDDVDLIIAGADGWHTEGALKAIADLRDDYPGRVHRLEYVDDATKWSLINSAHALLTLSHAEGFGRPVVEAMALGVPAIVPDHSAFTEVATDAAIMTPTGNVQKIARAIWRATSHAVLRERLIPLGRARAERFSNKDLVETVLEQWLKRDDQ